MTDRELLQQALEALNRSDYLGWQLNIPIIKALRERLAQPEQEPVVWMYVNRSTHETVFQRTMRSFVDHGHWTETPLYSEPLANHELQCVCGAVWCGDEMVHLPNKTPQRKPLSMQERTSIVRANTSFHDKNEIDAYGIIDDVEAAHGIKENT